MNKANIEQLDRAIRHVRAAAEVVVTSADLVSHVKALVHNVKTEEGQIPEIRPEIQTHPPDNYRQERLKALASTFKTASGAIQWASGSNVATIARTAITQNAAFAPAALLSSVVTAIDGYLTRRALAAGFADLSMTINTNFANMGVRFDWHLAEVKWRLDQMSDVASQIRDILTRPLEIQARELRTRAIASYNHGWYDEALLDFLDAMDKARVDYVIAQYIANIYLFHKRDPREAIKWYEKAAKYSEPYSVANSVAALAYQALAYYLADAIDKQRDYVAATACMKRATQLLPNEPEVSYELAQYAALSNDSESMREAMIRTLQLDARYVIKFVTEPDFHHVQGAIDETVASVLRDRTRSAQEVLALHATILAGIRDTWTITRGRPPIYQGSTIPARHQQSRLDHFAKIQPYVDNPDIDDYIRRLEAASALFADAGDIVTVSAATAVLEALPVPEKLEGVYEFIRYPGDQRQIEHYTYWGLGGDLL